MSQLNTLIKLAVPYLKSVNTHGEDKISNIIIQHSIAAAVAGLAGGILPGVAAVIAVVASGGAVWSMYYRLCQEMGIKISQNILKTLGSAVITNIVTQLGGLLVVELAASFIPGASLIASAAACYGVTYLAGYLFMKLIVNLFKAGKDPAAMTADELAAAGRIASRQENCKDIFKAARDEAKEKIRSGEIRREEK